MSELENCSAFIRIEKEPGSYHRLQEHVHQLASYIA